MNKIVVTILFLLISTCLPVSAQAATLYSSLRSDSYVDKIFILDVYVSSDEKVNAVSGSISFPQEKIEVISLIKEESILDLWIKEPSFYNPSGKINFEGVVLDSRLSNGKNKIMSIVFKIKEIGFAQIYFSSGMVLADDGQGTSILTELDSNALLLK